MAFDQSTRGSLQKLVNSCRGLLSDEFSIQLRQTYGLDPKTGEVTPMARLTHLDDRQRHTAEVLRITLAHYLGADVDDTGHRVAVLDRMVREQAFTVLNRLAALLMMEARGQLIESVSKGYQSRGYQLYSKIAGTALGETGQAYQVYLFSVFDELAQELPALFDRYAANGLLFPRESALRALLEELNHFEIEPLWGEDETIGWIYQYFNSKEERKAMRDASQAPRNSRELAVRNQFFTPRYVVEFLVDNTLGRLWFNATGGQTDLRDRCQYLLVKPDEQPQAAIKLRDPRTLKLLDPACGSMHFGLYAFDLFAEIYREAWNWEQQHGPGSLDVSTQPQPALRPLSQTYEDEAAFLREVPRLIIEHNIYGVDIDPRAAQIASLALWLRAQRAWHDAGVKDKARPRIGQGHVVAAVAPPAGQELRQQFSANIDLRDVELFEKTLQLLSDLPELGALLQVERDLPHLIRQVYIGTGTGLFAAEERESWEQAETRLREALTEFAQATKLTYQGRLFAQDALQGLRLIALCREVFDVVVMNPPFGEPAVTTVEYIRNHFPAAADNLLIAFIMRFHQLLSPGGRLGAITDRSWVNKRFYEDFRRDFVLHKGTLEIWADLGWNVLDANVEVSAHIHSKENHEATFFNVSEAEDKEQTLQNAINGKNLSFVHDLSSFSNFPGWSFVYDLDKPLVKAFSDGDSLTDCMFTSYGGVKAGDSESVFRLAWEVLPEAKKIGKWVPFQNGSPFSPYYFGCNYVVHSDGMTWKTVLSNSSSRITNSNLYFQSGIYYGKRTDWMYGYKGRSGQVPSMEGHLIIPKSMDNFWFALQIVNSSVYQEIANKLCGQHKYAGYINPIRIELCKLPDWSAELADITRKLEELDHGNETSGLFFAPLAVQKMTQEALGIFEAIIFAVNERGQVSANANDFRKRYNLEVECALGWDKQSKAAPVNVNYVKLLFEVEDSTYLEASSVISYILGITLGRWDVSCATGQRFGFDFSDPFTVLPLCPPGQLQDESSLPLTKLEAAKLSEKKQWDYPIDVAWQGVLVDDAGHTFDLEKRLHEVFSIIWKEHSIQVEQELLHLLNFSSLRDYFRSSTGFFVDHLRRYSRGRRQAPIYWPLSTASGSYTLWIYYPSLNNQTLFTVMNDFLSGPSGKLTQVSRECAELRIKGGGRSQDEEKQYEMLQIFEQELTDLHNTLQMIAPTYQPNHDDGVQITAAPLWPLFRHKPWQKALKDTWAKLEKGDYDWAHLAMAYWPDRVREKCKTDKSLAIAHGLEDLYVEPEEAAKKTRGKKK